jgi:hypothetical protein
MYLLDRHGILSEDLAFDLPISPSHRVSDLCSVRAGLFAAPCSNWEPIPT